MTEKIEWFYLDWTKYEIWWWAEYNAGNWIDITNDEIWLDGTYEWSYTDYSAIQWPAPDGFHVPLTTEWGWLKTIMDWLSLTTWNGWRINLHMPFAGRREISYGNIEYQGSKCYYWSSSPKSSQTDYLRLDSSGVYANVGSNRAYGYSVRCLKDWS